MKAMKEFMKGMAQKMVKDKKTKEMPKRGQRTATNKAKKK